MLQLGNFIFQIDDYPEELPLGGSSLVSVEKYPGGLKSIRDFGAFDDAITLSGTFTFVGDDGTTAVDRSNTIDTMWRAGQPVQLVVSGLRPRWVQITGFKPTYHNDYNIDYQITLEPLTSQDPNDFLYNNQSISTSSTTSSSGSTTVTTEQSTSSQRTYTVVSGDTLWGIAAKQEVYNDGSQYTKIVTANNIKDPNLITPGQVLIIP